MTSSSTPPQDFAWGKVVGGILAIAFCAAFLLCGVLIVMQVSNALPKPAPDLVVKEPVAVALPAPAIDFQNVANTVEFKRLMEDKLRAELERRGEFHGAEWTSLYLNLSDWYIGREASILTQFGDGEIVTFTANKLGFEVKILSDLNVDARDGKFCSCSLMCSIGAASHVWGNADKQADSSAWREGIGGYRGGAGGGFSAEREGDGTISGSNISFLLTGSGHKTSFKGDTSSFENIVDSLLRHYEHPKDPSTPGRFAMTACLIRSKRVEFEQKAGAVPLRVIGEETAAKLTQIDISKCPPDFQNSYREYIASWKKADEGSIAATWGDVEKASRRHRVGTLFFW